MSRGAAKTRARFGVRKVLISLAAILIVALGAGGWMGYSYYTYRTFTGNPNTYPSYVNSFGTVKTESFTPRSLGRSVSYDVYLPPGYDDPKNASVRYPVVYLLHGAPGAYDDWVTVGGSNVQMDTLLARNKVRPMIVVMPQGSPSRFAASTEYVDGPSGGWATYITKDLVGRVDSGYRTVNSAGGRAIAGLSEGGYAAMNLGLKNPSEFAVIGSFSGYFTAPASDPAFGGDRRLADENSPAAYLSGLKGPQPKIYFYVGAGDSRFVDQNTKFADALKAKGIPYEFHVFPGSHSWDLWRSRLPDFLTFASKNLKGG